MAKDNKEDNHFESIQDELMKRRTIALTGKLADENIGDVFRRMILLQSRSSECINLIIDSGGGSIDPALQLCDTMATIITAPVRGIALGHCGSAATFVMLYCDERISSAHSKFLIHSGSTNVSGIPINQTTSENLEHLLSNARATEEAVLRLYTNKLSPKSWANESVTDEDKRSFVKKLLDRGDQNFNDWISAEEAVEVGLIERIEHGKFDIFTE